MREHYAQQQTEQLLAGSLWQENDLIFPSTIGTPLDLRNLLREFKEVLRRANLPEIRFHDLRHTAASITLNRNIPVLTVSRILGHAKSSITLDAYGHLIPSAQMEAARAMEEALTLTPVHFEQGAEAVAANPKMCQMG